MQHVRPETGLDNYGWRTAPRANEIHRSARADRNLMPLHQEGIVIDLEHLSLPPNAGGRCKCKRSEDKRVAGHRQMIQVIGSSATWLTYFQATLKHGTGGRPLVASGGLDPDSPESTPSRSFTQPQGELS